ncbi:MAG TPA: hypothetical protein VGL63_17965 [Streptosporangiaceae bacterium]|jgi:hypothetical protein
MTHSGSTADTQAEIADLEKLAGELGPRGCKTILTIRDGRLPHLDVLNPNVPTLDGRIYAQADHFWWSHAEPIALRTHIPAAADAIARALAANPRD